MNPESLLRRFDVVAEAPNGVHNLRELILQLAVRGCLVPHEPADEPVSALLGRIAAELGRDHTPMPAGEVPYQTPRGWDWVRVGDAMNLVNGRAFKPTEWTTAGTPIIRIQNLNNPTAPFNFCATEVPRKFYVDDEDLLLSWSGTPGTSFGAFVWRRGRAVLNQHIFRCELRGQAYTNDFARIAINARLDEMIAQAHGGVGLQHITKAKLDRLAIVLPPLAEQRRIVAKVDELMALCDALEAQRHQRAQARARLNRSLLHHLTTARDAAEVAAHWRRLRENFGLVYDTPEMVAELRRALHRLAVRGMLTRRRPADGPPTTILSQAAEDQERHVAAGKLRRPPTPQPVAEDEAPFALPIGWTWTRLGALVVNGPRNGYSPKPVEQPTATRALTLSATTSGVFDGRHFKYLDEAIPEESDLWLQPGDLLFQRGNTIEYVGTAAIYNGPPNAFIYPDLMIRVRCSDAVDVRFVHLAANSDIARAHFAGRASGTSGSMPKISQQDVLDLPLPLPSRAEQERIVTKVSELTALCDRLHARLVAAHDQASRLAASMVHHFTAA